MINNNLDHIPVTQMIRNYAADEHQADFYGKFLWIINELTVKRTEQLLTDIERKRKGKPQKTHYTYKIPYDWKSCCMKTQAALMACFFGKNFESRDHSILKILDPRAPESISQLKCLISAKENLPTANIRQSQELKIDGLDENNWTVYSLRIYTQQFGLRTYVHSLILLQAKIDNQLTLKLYQSYVDQYTFKEDVEKDISYTRDEIFIMLDMLLEFVTSTYMVSNELFKRFFKAEPPVSAQANQVLEDRFLEIKYGNVSRSDMKRIDIEYAAALPANRKIKILKP